MRTRYFLAKLSAGVRAVPPAALGDRATLWRDTGLRGVLAIALLALLGLILAGQARQALASVAPSALRENLPQLADAQYLLESSVQRSPEQVDADPNAEWKALPGNGLYPLGPRQALWLRFNLPPSAEPDCCLIEIPYAALDRASLYSQTAAGAWTEQRSGDLTAINLWPLPHRHPLLAAKLAPDATTRYLLRIENAQGFSAPIRLVRPAQELRREQFIGLFLGSYFGLALLGFAGGLLAGLWLRDRAYLYYGVCAAFVGLTQAAITGVAGLHLWPNSPIWTDRSLVIFAVGMLVSLLLLSATIVSLAQRSAVLNKTAWAVAAAGLPLVVALALTDSSLRIMLIAPYMVLVLGLILVINSWAWRHGDRFAGWLLLAAAPLATSLALAVGRFLQWLPQSFATEQGILGSMVLELPAILAVLVLRSQHRRENTRRIRGMDRTDPETGLVNEQVFMERMTRMVARSERLRHQSAVMLIDIVNAENIQRDFGRKASAELPLRVAERLLSITREIDSAARLSGRRFGMLIEGPFRAEDAASLGPRIVARCMMPYKGLHDECVARVHLAYALVPYHGSNSAELMARLQDRLATALPDDKKAIYVLSEPASSQHRIRPEKDSLPQSSD